RALPPARVPDVAVAPRPDRGAGARSDHLGHRRTRLPRPPRWHGRRERRAHASRGGGGHDRPGRPPAARDGLRRRRARGARPAAQVRLAARLAGLLGPSLDVVYFPSSGAEAMEGALKPARKHTGRPRFLAFEGGFHGDTLGALSVGGNALYRIPFEPLLPDVGWLPFDDPAALAAIDD